MTYLTLKTNSIQNSFILLSTNHLHSLPKQDSQPKPYKPRTLSILGTDDYKRSLRRSFARAKILAFFNPDLTQFITLTYRQTDNTPLQVLKDIKILSNNHKRTSNIPFKYIYVLEYQKRGSIHVHMIANNALSTHINKNMHISLTNWHHGFTSVLNISDFDNNFRPYLYLFKYMSKAERIGSSFVHISRNFDKITNVEYDSFNHLFNSKDLIHKEEYAYTVNDKQCHLIKEYYRSKA